MAYFTQEFELFNNDNLGSVRTLVDETGQIWFVAKDVCNVLEIKNARDALTRLDPSQKSFVKLPITNSRGALQYINFNIINEFGFYSLISKARNIAQKEKDCFIQYLKDNKILTNSNVFILCETQEQEFFSILKPFLDGLDIEYKQQFNVGIYRVDLYIPRFNLIIEYDEQNHRSYNKDKEAQRQKQIENALQCDFVRLNGDKDHYYNLGVVIKEIFSRTTKYLNFNFLQEKEEYDKFR